MLLNEFSFNSKIREIKHLLMREFLFSLGKRILMSKKIQQFILNLNLLK